MQVQAELEGSVVYSAAHSQHIHRQTTVKTLHELVFTLYCSLSLNWASILESVAQTGTPSSL